MNGFGSLFRTSSLKKSKPAHIKRDGVIRHAVTPRERRPKKLLGFNIFFCDLTSGFWSDYS
jgi:hypothetical protein